MQFFFSHDNTDGYSNDDLNTLNAAWLVIASNLNLPFDPDTLAEKSLVDRLAETLLAAYDSGVRGQALIAAV